MGMNVNPAGNYNAQMGGQNLPPEKKKDGLPVGQIAATAAVGAGTFGALHWKLNEKRNTQDSLLSKMATYEANVDNLQEMHQDPLYKVTIPQEAIDNAVKNNGLTPEDAEEMLRKNFGDTLLKGNELDEIYYTFVEGLTTKEDKLFAPDEFIFRSQFDGAKKAITDLDLGSNSHVLKNVGWAALAAGVTAGVYGGIKALTSKKDAPQNVPPTA